MLPGGTRTARAVAPGAAAGLAFVMLAAAAYAQPIESVIGRQIVGQRVTIGGTATSDRALASVLETAVGSPLDLVDVRESLTHLMAMERFSDVRARASQVPGGILLEYELVPTRRITAIRFRGELGLSERLLRASIGDRFTTTPPTDRAPEIQASLAQLYRDRGYRRANVSVHVDPASAVDQADLVVEAVAGPRVRVSSVEIAPPPGVAAAHVRERLGLEERAELDPADFEKRVAQYADALRSGGYLEASVTPQLEFGSDGAWVRVRVDVSRGPRVVLEFRGDALPEVRQRQFVPIAQERSADQDLLEDAERSIQDYLRGLGYRDAVVTHTRELVGETLRVIFDVRKGLPYAVASVDIVADPAIRVDGLPPDLGIKIGVSFVADLLDAALARMAEEYRRRGFSNVTIDPQVVTSRRDAAPGQPGVAIRVKVTEGPRRLIESVALEGNTSVPAETLLAVVRSTAGGPFYERQIADDRLAIVAEYANRGFAQASVETVADDGPGPTRIALRFIVREGPRFEVDHVIIVGNRNISTRTIENNLTFRRGDPLGSTALVETRRNLAALGVFRQIRVTDIARASGHRRDVLVAVEEGPTTTVGIGAGLEGRQRTVRSEDGTEAVNRVEIAPRGFFDITRQNLWGKNRSISFFSRASIRRESPSPSGEATEESSGSAWGFAEYRLATIYREPRILGRRSDLVVTGALEQGIRSSFDFRRLSAVVGLTRTTARGLTVTGQYVFDYTEIFNARYNASEAAAIDRAFPQVRLSSLALSLIRDTRDDPIDPGIGTSVSVEAELASRALGSEVGFAKTYLQAFVYRALPSARRVVFAAGARVGLGAGFASTVPILDSDGNPIIGPDGQPETEVVDDIPAARRFYAGGDTTVRGFEYDRLGQPDTFDSDGFPLGGNAVVVFNGELRVPVSSWLGAVGFLDVGNVFRRIEDLDLGDLRAAAGFGVRLRKYIPIRFDVGLKFSRQRFANGQLEPGYAYYFSVGQAF